MKMVGIMIGTADVKALSDFYTKVLGEPIWAQDDWYGYGEVGVILGPHSEVHGKNPNPQRMIINFETEDVKAEFDRIKATGAEVIAEPYQPGGGDKGEDDMWLATFADPDGNYIQIGTPWKG